MDELEDKNKAEYFARIMSGQAASEANDTRADFMSFVVVSTIVQLINYERETGENLFQVCLKLTKKTLKANINEQLNVHHKMTHGDTLSKMMGSVMGDLEDMKAGALTRINNSCKALETIYNGIKESTE